MRGMKKRLLALILALTMILANVMLVNAENGEDIQDSATYVEYELALIEYTDDQLEFSELIYNEEEEKDEWVDSESGGVYVMLIAGQSIGSQIESYIRLNEQVREGATFEGWAKFKVEDDEYTFVPQSESKQYYTTEELLASDMPAYNVTFVPKWSDVNIRDYFPTVYFYVLNANGGEVANSMNGSQMSSDEFAMYGIYKDESFHETMNNEGIEVTVTQDGMTLESWDIYQAEVIETIRIAEGEDAPEGGENSLVIHYATIERNDNVQYMYIILEGYELVGENVSTDEFFTAYKNANYYAVANWKATGGTEQPDISDDEKLEEALEKEQEAVLDAITNGTVSEEVVSKETVEKVEAAIEAGKEIETELIVNPVDENQIDFEEKEDIISAAKEELGTDSDVMFLDIQVVLKADDEVLGNINELQNEIEITIPIPEEMKAENAKYVVIRNHDGEIDILPVTVNADGTITFKTDKFSTYALAFAEEETGAGSSSSNTGTDSSVPKTGDNSLMFVYTIVCVMAAAIIVLKKREI